METMKKKEIFSMAELGKCLPKMDFFDKFSNLEDFFGTSKLPLHHGRGSFIHHPHECVVTPM